MTRSPDRLPTYQDIEDAARQLEGVAHRTPVVTSRAVDARTGAQVFFKCENFQRRGVITFSSGNHAQAIALAGQLPNIPRVIVMPTDDRSLLRARFFLWERLKLVVEPTGALGAAALLEGRMRAVGLRVGVILSGGNTDFSQVPQWLQYR